MNPTTHVHGVTISAEVVDRSDLTRRLDEARAHVAAHQAHGPGTGLDDRARRLHELWASVAPPTVISAAGARGRVAFNIKRVVRKLSAWYVEPRFQAQREIDAEIARFASESITAIGRLEHDVEQLQLWNDRLQRELRVVRAGQEGSD